MRKVMTVRDMLALLLLVFLISACAGRRTNDFPTGGDLDCCANIIIIRVGSFFGSEYAEYPTVNDQIIAKMYRKEYVRFFIEPGTHTIGISPGYPISKYNIEDSVSINCEAGKKYYLAIEPAGVGRFTIKSINESMGEAYMRECKELR
jgi:hypothetical protein